MFNLHIGVPGVAPNLLHSIEQTKILKGPRGPQIISRKLWKQQFRGLINSRKIEDYTNITALRAAETTIAELSRHDSVAASQHALLGAPEECFFKNTVLPHTESRMRQVSDIFAAVPLRIHLTIQSQFEHLQVATNRLTKDMIFSEPRTTPSWAALVRRIKVAAPATQIVVWDFENPRQVALGFLATLLNINDPILIESLKTYIMSNFINTNTPPVSGAITEASKWAAEGFDTQYELDLQEISQMPGVNLIFPRDLPREYRI